MSFYHSLFQVVVEGLTLTLDDIWCNIGLSVQRSSFSDRFPVTELYAAESSFREVISGWLWIGISELE